MVSIIFLSYYKSQLPLGDVIRKRGGMLLSRLQNLYIEVGLALVATVIFTILVMFLIIMFVIFLFSLIKDLKEFSLVLSMCIFHVLYYWISRKWFLSDLIFVNNNFVHIYISST